MIIPALSEALKMMFCPGFRKARLPAVLMAADS
jgi:hypothetical protein